MSSANTLDAWVHATFGIDPASYPPNAPGAGGPGGANPPDPWAGSSAAPAKAGQPANGGNLPQPMAADCKVVRGKVRGPDNHVLCATHGHVLDIDAKTIIAHDLDDYKKRQLVAKAANVAMPIIDAAAKTIHAVAGTPDHVSDGHAPDGHAPDGHAANGHAANGAPTAPTQETKDKAYDAATMQVVANQIVEYLHSQYTDLAEAVEDVATHWSLTIDKLKEEAPKEPGSLLSQLGSALFAVTTIVFPELAIVKVAITVKDISEKVDKEQEPDKQRAEAAKTKALFASKMQAKEALDAFSKEVRTEARNARSALVKRVREAIAAFKPPPDFYDTVAKDFDKYVAKFAVETLGIKIGADQDPAAISKIQARLGGEIGKWLKQQYVDEHETAALLKSPAGMFVGYGAFTPEILQEKVKAYFEDNPDAKEDIDKDLRGEYTEEFIKKVLGEKD